MNDYEVIELSNLSHLLGYRLKSLADQEAYRTYIPLGGMMWQRQISISIEAPCPKALERGSIHYAHYPTPIGNIILASLDGRICYSSLTEDLNSATNSLQTLFPGVKTIKRSEDISHTSILSLLNGEIHNIPSELALISPASPFRKSVWLAAGTIGYGSLATYGEIARRINNPGAVRAVGSALSANHLAPFIPCHRVIPCRGVLGNYTGGTQIKKKLIEWELTTLNRLNDTHEISGQISLS